MNGMRICVALLCSLGLHATAYADTTLYLNGTLYTANEGAPWADAMIVEDGTIRFVGTEEEARSALSTPYETEDLEGRFVMPGIIDAHTHPGLVGALTSDEGPDEPRIPQTSREDMYAWLEAYADENWYVPIIVLGEWNTALFGAQGPHRDDLDKIFTYRPAFLFDSSGHSMWLNSAALFILGIDEETPDLSDGISYFVRDEDGRPTGWVKEFALLPYLGDLLLPDDATLKDNMRTFVHYLSGKGVTSLLDGGNFGWDDPVYAALRDLDDEGALPLRYEGVYHIYEPSQLPIAIEELEALRTNYAGGNLTLNTIKIHFDGVAEIHTAGLLAPYSDAPEHTGGVLFTVSELTAFILELAEKEIDLHLHVVGDRATRVALDSIEAARTAHRGDLPIEIALAHLEVVAPEDINRFQPLDIHANFTPHWFGGYFPGSDVTLGEERYTHSQRARSFVEAGANVTFSSDVVTGFESYRANPFFGMQTGMTRQEPGDGPNASIMQLESERLDLTHLLQGYTLNAARQLGVSDNLGSLEPGKTADFIILNRNPFDVSPYELSHVTPIATYLGGEKRIPATAP